MRLWRYIMTVLLAGAVLTVPAQVAQAAVTDADLAYRWAPVHYQDTASTYRADYLAPVDYDGDWNTLNNWNNLDAFASGLTGTVYYSVVETGTHWFIGFLPWRPPPSGGGGNGPPAEQDRDSRSAAMADRRLPACHRKVHKIDRPRCVACPGR
ncbi:hypothetical protein [Dactylosporangium sp. NPDC048998]|uniref:hypothetical protein n=1 Tax=Dactylosporangium sp. NPDC048998 TaxID=3363976 RepID=UPI003719FEA3